MTFMLTMAMIPVSTFDLMLYLAVHIKKEKH